MSAQSKQNIKRFIREEMKNPSVIDPATPRTWCGYVKEAAARGSLSAKAFGENIESAIARGAKLAGQEINAEDGSDVIKKHFPGIQTNTMNSGKQWEP